MIRNNLKITKYIQGKIILYESDIFVSMKLREYQTICAGQVVFSFQNISELEAFFRKMRDVGNDKEEIKKIRLEYIGMNCKN